MRGGDAHLLVDWSEHAELAKADVEGRAGELDVSVFGWALDDDDINRAGESGWVDVLVVLYGL